MRKIFRLDGADFQGFIWTKPKAVAVECSMVIFVASDPHWACVHVCVLSTSDARSVVLGSRCEKENS